jgi:hypothetical protein
MNDQEKLGYGNTIIRGEIEILRRDLSPAMLVAILLGTAPQVACTGGMRPEVFAAMVTEMLANTVWTERASRDHPARDELQRQQPDVAGHA